MKIKIDRFAKSESTVPPVLSMARLGPTPSLLAASAALRRPTRLEFIGNRARAA